MAFAQRWVHSGLVVAVVVMSTCITVLVLGATRSTENNYGLPGSTATDFYLKDTRGDAIKLSDNRDKTTVLVFTGHDDHGFDDYAGLVNEVASTYREDPSIRIFGIAYIKELGLLGPGQIASPVIENKCPELRVAEDADGTVARAYRVNGTPTLIIIDGDGVIRGRVPLNNAGAAVAINELIRSTRKDDAPIPTLMDPLSRGQL